MNIVNNKDNECKCLCKGRTRVTWHHVFAMNYKLC